MEKRINKATFCDCISGREFKSDYVTLEQNILKFNQLRRQRPTERFDLNAWFEQLGLPNIYQGELYRWLAWEDCGDLVIKLECRTDYETGELLCYIDYSEWPRKVK